MQRNYSLDAGKRLLVLVAILLVALSASAQDTFPAVSSASASLPDFGEPTFVTCVVVDGGLAVVESINGQQITRPDTEGVCEEPTEIVREPRILGSHEALEQDYNVSYGQTHRVSK